MLNASVGVQRALDRLRPVPGHRSSTAQIIHRHSFALARGVRGLVLPERSPRRRRRDGQRSGARRSADQTATAVAVQPTQPASRSIGPPSPAERACAAIGLRRQRQRRRSRSARPSVAHLAHRRRTRCPGRGRRDPPRRHRDQQRARAGAAECGRRHDRQRPGGPDRRRRRAAAPSAARTARSTTRAVRARRHRDRSRRCVDDWDTAIDDDRRGPGRHRSTTARC